MKRNRKDGTAVIKCRICDAAYQMMISSLSEPVDVYTEWIDKCEQANQNALKGKFADDEEEPESDLIEDIEYL